MIYLPTPYYLKPLCQSLALLDAILEPAWDLRYFSFDNHWADGKTMASMRAAEGDGYFISFCEYGTILIGHTPKSPLNRYLYQHNAQRQNLLASIPSCFAAERDEPAFEASEATVFIWCVGGAPWEWAKIPGVSEDDHSADLLFALDCDPATYAAWAGDYFEVDVPMKAVRPIYDHAPLTRGVANALNADRNYAELVADAREIGYPLP